MFTKEELLQKGVSPEVADEIISSFSSEPQEEDSPVQALEKALSGDKPEMEDLEKAGAMKGKEKEEDEKEEDDEEDEKEEKYMKKSSKKMSKAKEKILELVENMDLDAPGAICEMIDLKPYFNNQNEFNEEMVKAVNNLADAIKVISAKTEKNYDLMQKAAKVQLEQSKGLEQFLSVPNGPKGVVATANLQKAAPTKNFSPESNAIVYEKLWKAIEAKVPGAGDAISAFEANGKNLNNLNSYQRQYINEIISKEGK